MFYCRNPKYIFRIIHWSVKINTDELNKKYDTYYDILKEKRIFFNKFKVHENYNYATLIC